MQLLNLLDARKDESALHRGPALPKRAIHVFTGADVNLETGTVGLFCAHKIGSSEDGKARRAAGNWLGAQRAEN